MNILNNQFKAFTSVLLYSLFFCMAFSNCSTKKKINSVQKIEPFLKNSDKPFDTYEFNENESMSISRNTGTYIHVYPNSFVHLDGSPLTGKVSLKVREFHNSKDILISGIPMRIDGESDDVLESAGMIEIRAMSNGEEIKLKDNHKIDIELASTTSSEGYELYHLSQDKNWIVTNNFKNQNNNRKAAKLDSLNNLIATLSKSQNEEDNRQFILYGNKEISPYLKPFIGTNWVITDKINNEELLNFKRISWDEVSIKSINRNNNTYRLKFKKTFSYDYENKKEKYFEVNEIGRAHV